MTLRVWLVASIALAVGGCDFAPRYSAPAVSLPAKFRDQRADGVDLSANEEWWRSFNDRTLDDLQAQVDAANPDLAAAIAADEVAKREPSRLWPGSSPKLTGSDRSLPTSSRPTVPSVRRSSRLLRQQHSWGAGLLRDRHLGPGPRPRQGRQRHRRSKRCRPCQRPARTACRARPRLRQSARYRRRGQASVQHDRYLSLVARTDAVSPCGENRLAG